MRTVFRLLTRDEAAATAHRDAVSFGREADDEAIARWAERIDRGEVWGLVDAAGTVVAHGRLGLVDHWIGRRRVPTQHVSSVAVPPEHRGGGAGRAFMHAAVAHGTREGAGLSLLFPATSRLYRSLGYEHAGTFTRYRLDAREAPAVGPPLREASDRDWPAIRRCGDRAARELPASPVRPDGRWEELRAAAHHYVLDHPRRRGEVAAYALVDHTREAGSWQYTLMIRDWAAETARGLEGVVGFVGRHGTLGKAATFRDTVPDRWSALVPELDVTRTGGLYWMARGLALPAAVAARGFPPGLTGATTFVVDDRLVPEARGPWRLEVAEGRGRLEAAEAAAVGLDPRAVGPLFTGFRSADELARLGLAAGPPEALAWLGAAFAGPMPALFDFF